MKHWQNIIVLLLIIGLSVSAFISCNLINILRIFSFILLFGLAGYNAYTFVRHFYSELRGVQVYLAFWTIFSSLAVTSTVILGVTGILYLETLIIFQLIIFFFTMFLWKPAQLFPRIRFNLEAFSKFISGSRTNSFLICLLVCILCVHLFKGLRYPPFEWDSLTYHLLFPARWIQDHTMSIIPTPFRENASTYFPSNGSIIMTWFMIPFRDDLMADLVQIPAFITIILALFRIGHYLRISKPYVWIAPLLFGCNPMIFYELSTSLVDILMVSYFVCCIYFLLDDTAFSSQKNMVLAGLNLGLVLGTKFAAIPFSFPLILLFIYKLVTIFYKTESFRRIISIIFFGIIIPVSVTGSYFYVRNYLVTGNPVYPLDFKIGSIQVFDGAFISTAIHQSV